MFVSRNVAKAVILEDGAVLLQRKRYPDGRVVHTLPGGGQDPGESLAHAVVREALEEAAAPIAVEGLLAVCEYSRPSKSQADVVRHRIEFAFRCRLTASYEPRNGPEPDPHQETVLWVPLAELEALVLDPPQLAAVLRAADDTDAPRYRDWLGGA